MANEYKGGYSARQSGSGWDRVIAKTNEALEANPAIARQVGKSVDVADLLPAEARLKLTMLRQDAEDCRAAYLNLHDNHAHLRLEKQNAERRLRELTDKSYADRNGLGRHIPRATDRIYSEVDPHEGEDPVVVGQQKKVDRATAEFSAMEERRQALADRQRRAIQVVTICDRYLLAARSELEPGQTFPAFDGKVKRFATVEAARAEIAKLKADADATVTAPYPSAHAKRSLREEIDALAKHGRANLQGMIDHGTGVRWSTQELVIDTTGLVVFGDDGGKGSVRGKARVAVPDAIALIAHLFRDQLLTSLDAEIDAIADDSVALTPDQISTKLVQIADALLAAERGEVGLIEATGGIDHRADVDARALLNIDGPSPAAE